MLTECNLTPGELSSRWWKAEKYAKELEFQVWGETAASPEARDCSPGVSKEARGERGGLIGSIGLTGFKVNPVEAR